MKVWHNGDLVCELDNSRLHDAPVRHLSSGYQVPSAIEHDWSSDSLSNDLLSVLGDFAVGSREPIIREYDHEVQGNTLLKPLAGAEGDAPQDASVVRIDDSKKLMAMGLALLPEWGKTDPLAMGKGTVDECVRSLVVSGSNPDKIALLDNFCVGNPDNPEELGMLVETCKGMAEAAEAYGAPFVSGKDSFYNYFETDDGAVSIPTTCLISGMGVIEDESNVTGSSVRRANSLVAVIGTTDSAMGGSVYARIKDLTGDKVPDTDFAAALNSYRAYHLAVSEGLILAAHDVSEGGLAVSAAEMAFSMVAGMEIDLNSLPVSGNLNSAQRLFAESSSRILIECEPESIDRIQEIFSESAFAVIGRTEPSHKSLRFKSDGVNILDNEIESLKETWKNVLTPYY